MTAFESLFSSQIMDFERLLFWFFHSSPLFCPPRYAFEGALHSEPVILRGSNNSGCSESP